MPQNSKNTWKVPLTRPWITDREKELVTQVMDSGWLLQGPMVEALEEAVGQAADAGHAVAVSSGTAALHLALLAMELGPGDEVVVPSLSFVATASTVRYVGAVPIFADIDPATYNISAESIEEVLSARTRAICLVHQIGLPADLAEILELAQSKGLMVYEDAACALGATYRRRAVGAQSSLACFSFHPRKIVTTGEGGMVTTDDEALAERIRSLRQHGRLPGADKERYLTRNWVKGYNYRMSDLHAALGVGQMERLDEAISGRQRIAKIYDEILSRDERLSIPFVPQDRTHSYQSYMVRIQGGSSARDDLLSTLRAEGIEAAPGLTCIHRDPAYRASVRCQLDASEQAEDHTFLLPMYPQMPDETAVMVAERVLAHLRR